MDEDIIETKFMETILIIDDKRDNLVSFSAILGEMLPSCKVIISETGREGVEKALSEQPAVILLDIIMPDMDGYETCKILKENQKTASIPVILITAIKTDVNSRTRGLEIGADAFLSKPIDHAELAAQVKVMLRIRRAELQLRKDQKLLEKEIRKQTQDLQISEERFKKVFSQAPVGIEVYDEDGLLVDINQACLNIFGVKDSSEVKDFKLFEDPNLSDEIKRKLKNGESLSFDQKFDFDLIRDLDLYTTSRIGIRHLHLHISSFRISKKGGNGYLVHVMDITDRMHAEIQLRESEEKFRVLHLNSPDFTMLQNPDGEIVYISPQVEVVLGYSSSEFLGQSFPDHIFTDDRDRVYEKMMSVLGGEEVNGLEYRFVGKDDQIEWISHTARPIVFEDKVVRVQSSVRNITNQKESEIELAKYRIQMEDLVKERTNELVIKNEELEKFNSLFVGREFRIKELREHVDQLEKQLEARRSEGLS